MSKPSLDEFAALLDRVIENIPPQYLRRLNGGFNLRQGKKREDGYYILGEYVEDGWLGCYIVFYYGSFVGLLKGESRQRWEEEIIDTVYHEMQHHLESMAGRDDLGQKEMAELARALGRVE